MNREKIALALIVVIAMVSAFLIYPTSAERNRRLREARTNQQELMPQHEIELIPRASWNGPPHDTRDIFSTPRPRHHKP